MVVINVSFGFSMYLLRLIVCIISNVSGHSNLNMYHIDCSHSEFSIFA